MGIVMEEETCSASAAPSFEASETTQKFLSEKLTDKSLPISERYRALFTLRNLRGDLPRQALIQATDDPSNLLAHEAAFALGQMQDTKAVPFLISVLKDHSRHPIVRHEAGEALGAIGLDDYIPLLQECVHMDPAPEVRETCELALKRIEESKAPEHENDVDARSPFLSVDPAVAASSEASVQVLRNVLLGEDKAMYERYAALFALRNNGGSEATSAIIAALDAKSALLRHEVAYVLGQLQDKSASAALVETLKDVNEHPMVRHEAAEALGSIADTECVALLKQFENDDEPIVAQSCEVALRMLDFEQAGKSFEFLYLHPPEV